MIMNVVIMIMFDDVRAYKGRTSVGRVVRAGSVGQGQECRRTSVVGRCVVSPLLLNQAVNLRV